MADQYQYLTLLRGINVGGNNIIKMTELKSCFEDMGFDQVITFIQSGNVLFRTAEKNVSKLADKIEKELSRRFSYNSRIVLVPKKQLDKVVNEAPPGYGLEPDRYRYDVIFVKDPLTPRELIKHVSTREGVDRAWAGDSVLYFSRLISRASRSHLSRIINIPEYQYITVRNWNTTTRLLALMEK